MPNVVKITTSQDGEPIKNPKWCYVYDAAASRHNLCELQAFGFGESAAKFEEKEGKITCPDCIEIIKKFKSIKL